MSTEATSMASDAPDDRASRYVDRFDLLLGITTLSVIVQALVDIRVSTIDRTALVGALLVTLLVGATMSLALRTSNLSPRLRRWADIPIALIVLVQSFVVVVSMAPGFTAMAVSGTQAPPFLWLLLSVVAPVLVVRRLMGHQQITVQTLYGALAAYLLFAIAFGFAFQTTGVLQDTPFFGEVLPSTSFIYYSLVTITTVGYGDLSAATALGRLLSVCAAVVGQVYLVTIVAMVVSSLARSRTG